MNEHTGRDLAKHLATAAPTIAPPDLCQVAQLARLFTALENLEQELAERDPTPDDPACVAEDNRLTFELMDRSDAIAEQVEWIEAASLEGVYFQLLQVGSLFRDIMSGDGCSIGRARLRRRFERLHHLALEGLERLGGFDGDDYAKRHKTLTMAEFKQARVMRFDHS